MADKLKIRVSETAYEKLFFIVNEDKDYNCIRFKGSRKCCGKPRLEMLLDKLLNKQEKDSSDRVEELNFIFDNLIKETFKEITIKFENNSFMVKTIPYMEDTNSCSQCSKGDHSKHGSCSGCNQ